VQEKGKKEKVVVSYRCGERARRESLTMAAPSSIENPREGDWRVRLFPRTFMML
jgi:hypothetical protein